MVRPVAGQLAPTDVVVRERDHGSVAGVVATGCHLLQRTSRVSLCRGFTGSQVGSHSPTAVGFHGLTPIYVKSVMTWRLMLLSCGDYHPSAP